MLGGLIAAGRLSRDEVYKLSRPCFTWFLEGEEGGTICVFREGLSKRFDLLIPHSATVNSNTKRPLDPKAKVVVPADFLHLPSESLMSETVSFQKLLKKNLNSK